MADPDQSGHAAACVVERRDQGDVALLRLEGAIDERFEPAQVFRDLPRLVVLDLEGVRRITSFGVRQWSDAMKALPQAVRHLYVLRAPACYVDQLNMVLNFGGRAEVVSATALYFCERCQEERAVAIDVLDGHALLSSGAAPPTPCPTCGVPMALEDDPQQAFRYVAMYGAKALDPEVVPFLVETQLYVPRKVGPPPEELKLVHGDVTLLVLSGTLDQRFRPRRLASGVEGEVVLDLGGVVGCDATGVERFAQLLQALDEAGTVTLVDMPGVLAREYDRGVLPLGLARLYPVPSGMPLPPAPVLELISRREELLARARAESAARDGAGSALGRYRVLRPLSRGGMAEILLAVHEGIGGFEKLIALKKIRRKLLERRHVAVELFLNEAKIVANLNHPNIVQTFEVGEHGGDLFIAMEYVHGVDARTIVKLGKGKRLLSIEQVLYLGTQVAAALDHAHKARDLNGRPLHIVHRDVSLSNIVLGFDGQVKLVDFGIATAASVEQPGGAQDGLVGKFSYMSPEQVEKRTLDARSDVFSLGIVIYELIAAKPLFRRATDAETLQAVKEAPVPSLVPLGAPPEVDEVLARALARSPAERFADARALELALQAILQKQGGMGAHQLSLSMRALFPVESAAAPTASAAAANAGLGTPSGSGSGPSPHHSGTFAPAAALLEPGASGVVREHEETGVTQSLVENEIAAERAKLEDPRETPPLGVVAYRGDATPVKVVPVERATPAAPSAADPPRATSRAWLVPTAVGVMVAVALVVWLLLR